MEQGKSLYAVGFKAGEVSILESPEVGAEV